MTRGRSLSTVTPEISGTARLQRWRSRPRERERSRRRSASSRLSSVAGTESRRESNLRCFFAELLACGAESRERESRRRERVLRSLRGAGAELPPTELTER